jgi:hypothetical protein
VASVTLFDQTKLSPTSPFFYLNEQVTVAAWGLHPDDYITFEMVQTNAASMPRACGCDFVPAGRIALNAVQELLCPSCPSESRPVRLRPTNPAVVLDYPQGALLRAVYHGTGLETGEVVVIAYDSVTGDLTDAIRGCPAPCCVDEGGSTEWTPTGVYRCNGENYEEREESNCDEFRWVVVGSAQWEDTGNFRCVDGDVEAQQESICGTYRWVLQGPVTWTPNGETRCRGGNVERQELDNCGNPRWTIVGPVTWVNLPENRCRNGNVETLQVDDCGNTRWVVSGPVVWVPNGETRCVDGLQQVQEADNCGNTRWVPTVSQCDIRYYATLDLFCGARAYRPTDPRDPAATIPLQGCRIGDPIEGYIYPTPQEGATTAVYAGACGGCDEELLGYAVDFINGCGE